MLDMTARQLERVIYYEDYLVVDPGKTPLQRCQLLTETEYREAQEQYGESFTAKHGRGGDPAAARAASTSPSSAKELDEALGTTRSKQIRKKLAKRLKLVQGFVSARTPVPSG